MSKIVKGVKKVFKKVGNAIKKFAKSKIGKVIIAAAAIYFTAGLAAGSFAPSAVFGQVATTAGNIATGIGEAMGIGGTTAAAGTDAALTAATDAAITAAEVGSASEGASLFAGAGTGAEAATAALQGDLLGEGAVNLAEAGGIVEAGGGGGASNLADVMSPAFEESATEKFISEGGLRGVQMPTVAAEVGNAATQQSWIGEALKKIGIDIATPEGKFLAGQMVMGAAKGTLGYYASQQEAEQAAAMYAERLRNRAVGDYTGWFNKNPVNIAQAQSQTPESAKVYLGESENESQPRAGSSKVARTYIAGKTLPATRRG